VEDVVGGRQVQAEAAGAEREDEDRCVCLRWNCSIIVSRSFTGTPP
jgi:hypothetical protein